MKLNVVLRRACLGLCMIFFEDILCEIISHRHEHSPVRPAPVSLTSHGTHLPSPLRCPQPPLTRVQITLIILLSYYQRVNPLTRLSLLQRQPHLFHAYLGGHNSVIPAAAIQEEKSFSYPSYAALNMQYYQFLKRKRNSSSLLLCSSCS